MQLIGRIYKPDVAVLPIGDHYTMGPREASVAIELLGVKRVVPCHWGTFGLLTGTPDQLDVPRGRDVGAHGAGRLDHGMRERWFGATGRRCPSSPLEGDVDVGEALVVDDVGDETALRRAFDAGTPVVVRAGSPEAVKAALARPEVSCVARPARISPTCSRSTSPS